VAKKNLKLAFPFSILIGMSSLTAHTVFAEAENAPSALLEEEKNRPFSIKGGDGFQNAVPLSASQNYILQDKLDPGEFEYFSFEMKKPGHLNYSIRTTKPGVINENSNDLATHKYRERIAYGCLAIFHPENYQRDSIRVSTTNSIKRKFLDMNQIGTYFFRVGCAGETVRGDGIHFQVSADAFDDLSSDEDAGPSAASSMFVKPRNDRMLKSHLSGADRIDYYRFEATAGKSYEVGMLLQESPKGEMLEGTYELSVEDYHRKSFLKSKSAKGAGIRPKVFTPKESASYVVKIERISGKEKGARPYTLILKEKGSKNETKAIGKSVDQLGYVKETSKIKG